jgi:hypothetical protein
MILSEYQREVARLLKLLSYTIEQLEAGAIIADRTDISAIASWVKRMPGEGDELSKLARQCASSALRWAYFNEASDEQNMIEATSSLLKAMNLLYKSKT